MTDRIRELAELTLAGQMYPAGKKVKFDRMDLFLPPSHMIVKRIHDYLLGQDDRLTTWQTMARPCALDNSQVEADYLHYGSHESARALLTHFYGKPVDSLSTFEWQHATPDYTTVLQGGIQGVLEHIHASSQRYAADPKKTDFLACLEVVANTLLEWAVQCAERARTAAAQTQDPLARQNWTKLAQGLQRVPKEPPRTLYEAVLCLYILFTYEPDSVGTLDRTLYPYYRADLENGTETRESAREILQEFFLMLQANTPKDSPNFTRGGESHFCVGGYDENGQDVFNDFSLLIIEAVTELPTFIPQISLRWTKKLPYDVFEQVLSIAVQDENKRIAFINDEVKIHAAMHISGFPYEVACRYSSVGCNEVAYPGGFVSGSSNANLLRSIDRTMYERGADILRAETFDAFYVIYKEELYRDLDLMQQYDDAYMQVRGRDSYYATSLLFPDCIEQGKSFAQGACRYATAGVALIGLPNVIDSLAIVRQFVYDEHITDMATLLHALQNDWAGHEDLLCTIRKRGKFFGNDDETSNAVARRLTETLYEYARGKISAMGYPISFGNLQGYQPHHQWFGALTRATPDGRHNGEMLKFGLGQSNGYDRAGLTALLHAVATCDPHGIISGGGNVTNLNLDAQLVKNANHFPKTARMLEAYLQQGGSHFQLNFVSREDLEKARVTPREYQNLRVRVSGFSDYFVRLDPSLQDDIIHRTVQA